ncbi:MAG: phosphate signaling complex protein PhoU, partial [Paracoccaceae bacterium]|nr:phosphate signaling complex protein PhoU [Paracoccaceae bacterium]
MTTAHTVTVFDNDLEHIQALIMKMGGLVETAILDAAQALDTRDEELADRVRRNDTLIDELEEKVNSEAARLIALRAPAASDLRTILSVMKISANLERVGDYAKNIAKRSTVLAQMQPIAGAGGALRRMAKAVEVMMKDALDAYTQRDVELAADVRMRDQDVDQMYNAM